jgi:predicted transcriptional regulator
MAATQKQSVAYRLSSQAIAQLDALASKTGPNKTAIIEMAIAALYHILIGK